MYKKLEMKIKPPTRRRDRGGDIRKHKVTKQYYIYEIGASENFQWKLLGKFLAGTARKSRSAKRADLGPLIPKKFHKRIYKSLSVT